MARIRSIKTFVRENDRMASLLCRTQGAKCCRCGDDRWEKLQWCHIVSRKIRLWRWKEFNCVCMCAHCHAVTTQNPIMFAELVLREKGFNIYESLLIKPEGVLGRDFYEAEYSQLMGLIKKVRRGHPVGLQKIKELYGNRN